MQRYDKIPIRQLHKLRQMFHKVRFLTLPVENKFRYDLHLPYDPVAVLCIGKGAEKFCLVPISEEESHAYYRENGTHYVPKVKLSELMIEGDRGGLLERPQALQDRVFQKLFDQAEIAKYSDAERRQYEFSQKEYWDYTSSLETAERKGEKKGVQKEKFETARKMKADGMTVELIAKYTGLTKEEINNL